MSGSSYDHLWRNTDQLGERYDAVAAMRDRLAELGYEDAAADTNRVLALLDAAKTQAGALVKVWEAVEKFASPAYHYEPSGRVDEALREYAEKRVETQKPQIPRSDVTALRQQIVAVFRRESLTPDTAYVEADVGELLDGVMAVVQPLLETATAPSVPAPTVDRERLARFLADHNIAVWDDPDARRYFLAFADALIAAGLVR